MSFDPELQRRVDRCIRCGLCDGLVDRPESLAKPGIADIEHAKNCPTGALEVIGRNLTPEEATRLACADEAFYRESGGGVTFTGGEPLAQGAFLLDAVRLCKAEGIHVAVDSSGFGPEELVRELAPLVDLVLFDIKCVDPDRHMELTGVPNEGILQNLFLLASLGARVQLSIPLIPALNDDEYNLRETARMAAELGVDPDLPVRILPYHDAARSKYGMRGQAYPCESIRIPDPIDLDRAVRFFSEAGIATTIGGLA